MAAYFSGGGRMAAYLSGDGGVFGDRRMAGYSVSEDEGVFGDCLLCLLDPAMMHP